MKLTKRQKEILDFIREFIDEQGYSPSMEEIAARFGIASLNAVYKHLEALESRGHLHREANRARSIELHKPDTARAVTLPLFGYVAAGRPIEAITNAEVLAIPENLLPPRSSCYVLRVQGDSMIEEHIADGDYVIVESRPNATAGEMIVALVDGESATLKRFHPEGPMIRLQPSNPDVSPIVVEAARVNVQGVVVGVMRKYR